MRRCGPILLGGLVLFDRGKGKGYCNNLTYEVAGRPHGLAGKATFFVDYVEVVAV